MIKYKYVISIDPSINYCGCAIHNINGELFVHTLLRPSCKSDDYLKKSKDIYDQVSVLLNTYPNTKLVLEVPQFWGSAGFMARESGAVFKLTFLCGMLFSLSDTTLALTPNDWKGQMPKHVVNNRLRKVYPNLDIAKMDHNIVDALGIGHFYLTNLKAKK